MNKFKQTIANSNGAVMIQILVFAGILGGVTTIVMKMHENQTKTIETLESKLAFAQIENEIGTHLIKNESCVSSLGGDAIGSINAPSIAVNEIKDSQGNVLFNKIDTYKNSSIKINNIELTGGDMLLPLNEGTALLTITFERVGQHIYGAKILRSQYPLSVIVDDEHKITSCSFDKDGVLTSVRSKICEDLGGVFTPTLGCTLTGVGNGQQIKNELCKVLGGVFNPVTNKCVAGCPSEHIAEGFEGTGLECKPPVTPDTIIACPNGTFISGFDNAGNKICRAPANGGSCPLPGQAVVGILAIGTVVCAPLP